LGHQSRFPFPPAEVCLSMLPEKGHFASLAMMSPPAECKRLAESV
jgi:hypothetical protein